MKPQIIPAMLVERSEEARRRLDLLKNRSAWIQWDVMDGKFVPPKTWAEARTVKAWKLTSNVELHLMVQDPEKYIQAWRSLKPFRRAVWHVEAPVDHERLIRLCHRFKREAGLAISPKTPVASLVPFLRKVDCVLILGVEPGWSGQTLQRSTFKKIKALKQLAPRLTLAFDGGIEMRHVTALIRHGVSRLIINSAIFKNRNPLLALQKLEGRAKASYSIQRSTKLH